MKLALQQCGVMELTDNEVGPPATDDRVVLTVLRCAVCRTDAKMWRQGHRDLVLPRVLGHEIAGVDPETGRLYAVWPGQACGTCRYCRIGRENLCKNMQILGFHTDGGFAGHVSVPWQSLIPVPGDLDPDLVTFAEPVACVFNGLSRIGPAGNEKVIIFGGGVIGMLAALICREKGCHVTVIEQSEEKIARVRRLCRNNRITLGKDTEATDFDIAINCCDSPAAFTLCVAKLCKGGRLSFFSGLQKNEEVGTNLLNLIHYRELEVVGAYGPGRDHMVQALQFCSRQGQQLQALVERVIGIDEVESVLPQVLSGTTLRFIVDFSVDRTERRDQYRSAERMTSERVLTCGPRVSAFVDDIINRIVPPSDILRDQAQGKVDRKTKPLGALGRIENLAVQLSTIKEDLNPAVDCMRMFVFAGDHGVVEEGVSAFPAKVTVQMVENFLAGGAAINIFCRQFGIEIAVIDMGVNGDFDDHPLLLKKKVGRGTRNFVVQQAMSRADAITSIERGAQAFFEKNRERPCDLVGMGEMGIGNSSSATAVICGALAMGAAEVAGRGTGIDDGGLLRKREIIDRALALHQPRVDDALDLLSTVGGYELGGICGAVLAAASQRCCVVLDGIISTAAGLLAYLLCPDVKAYLVAGHRSVESGQRFALEKMGLDPVIGLDLRLGEGTGAAITMNLIDLACRMMREMASFEEAGVDSGAT